MPKSRDLFDDTTMTFGEHLEVLRVHVFRAVVGIVIAVGVMLYFGKELFHLLRAPIETQLRNSGIDEEDIRVDVPKQSFSEYLKAMFSSEAAKGSQTEPQPEPEKLRSDELRVEVDKKELLKALGQQVPELVPDDNRQKAGDPEKTESKSSTTPAERVSLILTAPEFSQLQRVIRDSTGLTTLKPEEGFMAYMKICLYAGLLLSSPWVFYQLWLFVAAGLYPHERKYVHIYLPMSVGLFIIGALAGYFYAFPMMLQFLIGFNKWIGVSLQPRLSEYITLAMLMPLMFGVSFQLPLVMVFLERIGICTVDTYKDNWRIAVLIISIASMVLTTSPDPWSMLLMMIPLLFLYVLGIYMCGFKVKAPASPIR